jgi:hypothetical protein
MLTCLSCLVVSERRYDCLSDVVSNHRMIEIVLEKSVDSGIMSPICLMLRNEQQAAHSRESEGCCFDPLEINHGG